MGLKIVHIFDFFPQKLRPTQPQNVVFTKIIFNAAGKNISREILKHLQTQAQPVRQPADIDTEIKESS